MPDTLAILDKLPPPAEFYARYWNARPFLVRDVINTSVMDCLIAPNELAALAMEKTARSRIVSSADWLCRCGPFEEDDFAANCDGIPWSLLVHNVDQFHPPTASLLPAFNFAPRWLMDDIMVSFSSAGGGVGGHVDSYHVFLVQGKGCRRWTVGRAPVTNELYIEGIDLKILKDPVKGDTIEMGTGDVLYVPPRFAHEGITLRDALTFSIGFLGPTPSEMRADFGIDFSSLDNPDADIDTHLYSGAGLTPASAGFVLAPDTIAALYDLLGAEFAATWFDTPDFAEWLARYITGSTSDDPAHGNARPDTLTPDGFTDALGSAGGLVKPPYVKFALLPPAEAPNGGAHILGVNRQAFVIDTGALPLIHALMAEVPIAPPSSATLGDHTDLLCALYNAQAVDFADL